MNTGEVHWTRKVVRSTLDLPPEVLLSQGSCDTNLDRDTDRGIRQPGSSVFQGYQFPDLFLVHPVFSNDVMGTLCVRDTLPLPFTTPSRDFPSGETIPLETRVRTPLTPLLSTPIDPFSRDPAPSRSCFRGSVLVPTGSLLVVVHVHRTGKEGTGLW